MTSLSGWIGIGSFVLCIGLIIHAVIVWPSDSHELIKPSWGSISVRFLITSAALFVWLASIMPLLGWAFWYGDNDHWFWHYAWIFALLISVATSAIAVSRVSTYGATSRFLRFQLWVTIILLLAFGMVIGYESLHRIEGLTAESAAQNVFNRLFAGMDGPVTLVEDMTPPQYGQDPEHYKSYWIMGPKEPRGRLEIARHKWFGWVFVGNQLFQPSVDELNRAKEVLSSSSNRDSAVLILQSIVASYPNTPAEAEARDLLQSLGEPLRPR